jgi:uncharacterized protein
MPVTTQEVRRFLLEQNAEFRHLADEHSRCESQLEQLLNHPYMSAEDLALEVTLKKLKLRLKDEMERIVARQQQAGLPH